MAAARAAAEAQEAYFERVRRRKKGEEAEGRSRERG
jgi:hypothetical protein